MNTKQGATTYPELRALMAKHGLNNEKMGRLLYMNSITFGRKLSGKNEFTYNELLAIKDYFASLGEGINIDKLFFAWRLTKVNEGR